MLPKSSWRSRRNSINLTFLMNRNWKSPKDLTKSMKCKAISKLSQRSSLTPWSSKMKSTKSWTSCLQTIKSLIVHCARLKKSNKKMLSKRERPSKHLLLSPRKQNNISSTTDTEFRLLSPHLITSNSSWVSCTKTLRNRTSVTKWSTNLLLNKSKRSARVLSKLKRSKICSKR